MKIKKVTIKNFRGISDKGASFNCSSYNTFIGNNGTSKTSILEAINMCLASGYAASRLSLSDFHQGGDNRIEIAVFFDDSFEVGIPDTYGFGAIQKIMCQGIALVAKKRDKAAAGKAFSDLVTAEHLYIPVESKGSEGWTIKRKSGTDFKITERQLSLSYATAVHPRVFYFGKERNRQMKKGYNSTISNIIDDLNWRFEKKQRELDDENKFKHIRKYLECHVFENTGGDTLKKTIEATNKHLEKIGVDPIEISLIKTLSPYDNAELIKRFADFELPISATGSGVEIIDALVFLLTIAKISKDDIVIVIDEPELHLHPSLQDKLAKLLMTESENSQVFISTHSPFFFKNVYMHELTNVFINKTVDSQVVISNAKDEGFGLLKWSPSWGEICFFAYDLATVEFHDDLYSSIQDKYDKPTVGAVESWFIQQGQDKEIVWTNEMGNNVEETLMTSIRNRIHHGDNIYRPSYNYEQLKDSIMRMIKLL